MKSAQAFAKMKAKGERIAAITAYDATFAALAAEAGCDTALVGDSLGMVIQGRQRTQGVRLADVAYHTSCAARGAPNLHLIADLPFGSYERSPEHAFAAAVRLIRAGASMVKLEGGEQVAETISFLTERGIPVCAHVGLLPQAALATGYAMQGRSAQQAEAVLADAKAASAAGATLTVLESVPAKLAKAITEKVASATIGIGAGRDCDGQILVLYDVLGVFPGAPRFSKNFLAGRDSAQAALRAYVEQVKAGEFPGDEHTLG